ncbi:MAG TPA: MetQ/NlpA family ABC transporter substrate-binding protein [Bacillaceae bacterium]|nr:MetQ/NlpA family ABC transporter substrate-binding protein [Paenibacillus bovis]HLU22245.1 MetQ/NlpA family ABC transporter substrate-binding protein [Bacillaceae bacterium]
MKRLLMLLTVLLITLAACGKDEDENVLKVASINPPMTEILEIAAPILEEEGIKLEIVSVSDNIQPNNAVDAGEVDANFFGHGLWMEMYNENSDGNLVVVKPIYHATLGLYSKNYDSIEELPEGATIAIPNDPTNRGRSLAFLHEQGVIQLTESAGIYGTVQDIEENPNNYEFQEVDLLMLARMYDDADASVMYPSYAAPLDLLPSRDALLTENPIDEFAISLVAREDNVDSEPIQKLAEAMTSQEVKEFLEENYPESAIPAF